MGKGGVLEYENIPLMICVAFVFSSVVFDLRSRLFLLRQTRRRKNQTRRPNWKSRRTCVRYAYNL